MKNTEEIKSIVIKEVEGKMSFVYMFKSIFLLVNGFQYLRFFSIAGNVLPLVAVA